MWGKGLLHQQYIWNIILHFRLQEQRHFLNIESLIVFPNYGMHQNHYSVKIQFMKCEKLIELSNLFSTESCLYA